MTETKIFVYGTLMQGFDNHSKYLEGRVKMIKRAYVRGALYHLRDKRCPALVDGNNKVYGEVITFYDSSSNTLLGKMDIMEMFFMDSTSAVYARDWIEVYYLDGSVELVTAYKYVQSDFQDCEKSIYIPYGDWREYMRKSS